MKYLLFIVVPALFLAVLVYCEPVTASYAGATIAQAAHPFPDTLSILPSAPSTVNWLPIALFCVWACRFEVIAVVRLQSWFRIQAALGSSNPLKISTSIEVPSPPVVLSHELCHLRRHDNLTAAIHT